MSDMPNCPICLGSKSVMTSEYPEDGPYYCHSCILWFTPDDPAAPEADIINHPAHYTSGKFEPIDVIDDWDLGYKLGNVVKYIARAGKKDPAKKIEDLKKAQCYLAREIAKLEQGAKQ